MLPAEAITRWTIRAAFAFYVLAMTARLARRVPAAQTIRIAWTAGCFCYLLHVAAAFHFYHGWSHAAAYRDTACRTAERFGFYWGGGLYFNYAFTIAWVVDTIRLWRRQNIPRWMRIALHAFFAFMFFNATVVFGAGFIRWAGILGTAWIGALWWREHAPFRNKT
jgi:hypothetical protein